MKETTIFNWFFLAALFIFAIMGCNKSSEGELPGITHLEIVADAEGDGVILSWDVVHDVDGYDVVTPDGDTIELDWNENSYNDDSPSSTGEYAVNCFTGSAEGDTSQISSAPFAYPAEATLKAWPDDWCAFKFDTIPDIGINPPPNPSEADFFLNTNSMPFDFTSADELPYNGNRVCHILDVGDTDFYLAPSTGYYNTEGVNAGDYYAFNTQGDFYAKVYVTSAIVGQEATIIYWLQTIQSLRIF